MGRAFPFLLVLFLLSSSVSAQTTFTDRKRNFAFPVPSGWREVSKDVLSENYEEMDEGIDGTPITLTAFESNPMQRRTAPVVIVRYQRKRPAEMTTIFERFKSDSDAAMAAAVAELNLASVYKVRKPRYYPDKPAYRLSYSWENHNLDTIREWKVRMLGQYSIVTLHFRGLEDQFKKEQEGIEAAIENFAFEEQYRLIREELPPPPPPAPVRRATREPPPLRAPDQPEDGGGIPSGTILVIMAVAIGGGILLLVVVLAGRGRTGGGRRRNAPRRRR